MTILILTAKAMAFELDESRSAVSKDHTKMKFIDEVLEKNLILLDRSGGVPDAEKYMEELNKALEQYWEKREILRKENEEVLMKVDLALEQKVTTSAGAGAGPG